MTDGAAAADGEAHEDRGGAELGSDRGEHGGGRHDGDRNGAEADAQALAHEEAEQDDRDAPALHDVDDGGADAARADDGPERAARADDGEDGAHGFGAARNHGVERFGEVLAQGEIRHEHGDQQHDVGVAEEGDDAAGGRGRVKEGVQDVGKENQHDGQEDDGDAERAAGVVGLGEGLLHKGGVGLLVREENGGLPAEELAVQHAADERGGQGDESRSQLLPSERPALLTLHFMPSRFWVRRMPFWQISLRLSAKLRTKKPAT